MAGLLFLAVVVLISLTAVGHAATQQDCQFCHDEPLYRVDFKKSIHANNGCTSCHTDITNIEKHRDGKEKPAPVDCGSCHQDIAKEYRQNFHYLQEDFRCSDCHRNIHAIKQDKNKNIKLAIIEKCTECHGNADYAASGHGEAVLKGNQDAASCADCHGLHNTRVFHTSLEQYPAEAREFYTQKCKRCHADSAMMKRNNLSDKMVAYYESTYHGKVQELGYPAPVAGCADCHTKHNILPKDDPRSSINPANLEAELRALSLRVPTPVPELQGPPRLPGPGKVPLPVLDLPLHVRASCRDTCLLLGSHVPLVAEGLLGAALHGQDGHRATIAYGQGRGAPADPAILAQRTDHARAADPLVLYPGADGIPAQVFRDGLVEDPREAVGWRAHGRSCSPRRGAAADRHRGLCGL